MRFLQQIVAITWLNIRNLPQRFASSAVAIVGVAAVVLVFAAVLSMAKGFERTMISAGSEDTAIRYAFRSDGRAEQRVVQRSGTDRRERTRVYSKTVTTRSSLRSSTSSST